jgi:hypothetical protein
MQGILLRHAYQYAHDLSVGPAGEAEEAEAAEEEQAALRAEAEAYLRGCYLPVLATFGRFLNIIHAVSPLPVRGQSAEETSYAECTSTPSQSKFSESLSRPIMCGYGGRPEAGRPEAGRTEAWRPETRRLG